MPRRSATLALLPLLLLAMAGSSTAGQLRGAPAPASAEKCSVCGHVYDAAKDGGGKPFAELPDTWKCPVCGAPKSAYKPSELADGRVVWVHDHDDHDEFAAAAAAPASMLFAADAPNSNADLVFPPPADKSADLPEKILILIPGANVATEFYELPVRAIQAASRLRLWVVVPAMPGKTCITICPSASACFPLQSTAQSVVAKATAQGYGGTTGAPDAFIAGHSLGGVCAGNLAQGYASSAKSAEGYAALVVMGSYVSNDDVASFPMPVLTVGAELDGGLGRPGVISKSLLSSDSAALSPAEQMRRKPVLILPGMDHSSFCPGFAVPGDVFPADVDAPTATASVGAVVSAFLHLQTAQADGDIVDAAQATLGDAVRWTRQLLQPLFAAQALEVSDDQTYAPWCATAQRTIAGLKNEEDSARLVVSASVYKTDAHQFEHTRVKYSVDAASGVASFNVSGHNAYYSDEKFPFSIPDSCLVPAKELGCKLASADRVAQQLNISKADYDGNLTCADVNRRAVEVAEGLLGQTQAGANALKRYKARGRPFCFGADFTPLGNIGPLFVSETLSIKDNGTCLEVSSLAEGPTALDSWLFPGVHYCKLLSPARVIDYVMIDSLKKVSGCLNK